MTKFPQSQKKVFILLLATALFFFTLYSEKENIEIGLEYLFRKKASVKERVLQYSSVLEKDIYPIFKEKQVMFPPHKVYLSFFKETSELLLFAQNKDDSIKYIKKYKVTAASGKYGPKLKEGDNQVPEGIYKIEFLNPNSIFHLSLRVNYPNAFDKKKAHQDSGNSLGGDIMIHGGSSSIGCIAIGNDSIEELFVLAAMSNYTDWELILAPFDLRNKKRKSNESNISWLNELDDLILAKLTKLPLQN
jgi:murein L,D-transpeptidase YafK